MTGASSLRGRFHRFLFPNDLSPYAWRWAMPWWSLALQGVVWMSAIGALAVMAWRGVELSGVWLLAMLALLPALMSSSLPKQLTKTDRSRLIDLSLTPDGPALWVMSRVRIAQAEGLAVALALSAVLIPVMLHHGSLPGVNLRLAIELALALFSAACGLCLAVVSPLVSARSATRVQIPQEKVAEVAIFGGLGCAGLMVLTLSGAMVIFVVPLLLVCIFTVAVIKAKRARAELPYQANLWARTEAERIADGERTPWWAKKLW